MSADGSSAVPLPIRQLGFEYGHVRVGGETDIELAEGITDCALESGQRAGPATPQLVGAVTSPLLPRSQPLALHLGIGTLNENSSQFVLSDSGAAAASTTD